MTNNWNEIFDYESETGKLRWKIKPCTKVRCGDIAGCHSRGYLVVRYKKVLYLAHRVIYRMVYGEIPVGMEIDHKNRVRDDNRIENLRLATRSENVRNSTIRSSNTSGFIGVSWCKKMRKWVASLKLSNRKIYLGFFVSKSEAIAARLTGEKEHHGEFAQYKFGTMSVGIR